MHWNHPEGLLTYTVLGLPIEFLIQQIRVGARGCTFLISSQLKVTLLVQEPHLEPLLQPFFLIFEER